MLEFVELPAGLVKPDFCTIVGAGNARVKEAQWCFLWHWTLQRWQGTAMLIG